jgi:hypothetical protein
LEERPVFGVGNSVNGSSHGTNIENTANDEFGSTKIEHKILVAIKLGCHCARNFKCTHIFWFYT